jgi:hypothetical protein
MNDTYSAGLMLGSNIPPVAIGFFGLSNLERAMFVAALTENKSACLFSNPVNRTDKRQKLTCIVNYCRPRLYHLHLSKAQGIIPCGGNVSRCILAHFPCRSAGEERPTRLSEWVGSTGERHYRRPSGCSVRCSCCSHHLEWQQSEA